MTDVPTNPELPPPAALARVITEYGGRWEIERVNIEVWTAVHRSPDGRHIRVLVGTPDELLGKLETAETVEPPGGSDS